MKPTPSLLAAPRPAAARRRRQPRSPTPRANTSASRLAATITMLRPSARTAPPMSDDVPKTLGGAQMGLGARSSQGNTTLVGATVLKLLDLQAAVRHKCDRRGSRDAAAPLPRRPLARRRRHNAGRSVACRPASRCSGRRGGRGGVAAEICQIGQAQPISGSTSTPSTFVGPFVSPLAALSTGIAPSVGETRISWVVRTPWIAS